MNAVFCHGVLPPSFLMFIYPTGANPFGFYKDFDMHNIANQTVDGIDLLVSDNDIPEMGKSRDKIIADIPAIRTHVFPEYGHFVLPELPEIIPLIKF